MTTIELQSEIKTILQQLGWSIAKLAEIIYTEEHDDYEESEEQLQQFKATLKKQLERESTPEPRLIRYLEIISYQREFEKLDIVMPFYVKNDALDNDLEKVMEDISKKITKKIKSDDKT